MWWVKGCIEKLRKEGKKAWEDPLDLNETEYENNQKNLMGERAKKIIRDILDEKYG
jgi:hypothetical protein